MESTQDLSSTSPIIMASDDSFEDDTFECPKDIVDDVLLESPAIGMSFPTVDAMFNYYKHYGKQRGFSITRRTMNKDIDGVLRGLTFTCSRYGKLLSKSKGVRKHRVHSKNECKARLRAHVVEGDRWEITMFVDEHNHALSPSKSRYFRCNREISAHVRRQLEINDIAGIRPNKSHNAQVIEAGGHENLCFLEKDTRNHLAKVRRMRLGEGDANAIQSYFLKMQSLNEGFFSVIDWDEKGCLKNVFWADPRSRAACREFGDVISFDTTYLTNMYDMPFAPFVGVNHHGQSILLGCGLISNEDTETFIWLFRTWLACMSGVAPTGIITDQDKAMKNAIAVVFPGTRHRLCLWHILKKVPEKLGSYTLYDDIAGALGNVVYDSQSIVDFESGWENMIQNFKLEDNAWLATLYEERAMWVPIFVKNFFWAGMSTTQRSESMNAFFDGYVNSKTTLKQFVEQYSNALRSKVEKESKADFDSFHKQVQCATFYEMEKQIQSLYTMEKFKEFQDELKGMVYCGIISVNRCGTILQFVVVEDIAFGEKGRKTVAWNVYCDASAYEVKCTCYQFEFRGIPCRHSLTVLIRNGVKLLPAQYIFTRWRKDVRRCHTRVKINYDGWSITSEQRRYDDLCKSFTKLADLAADNEEYFLSVKQLIEDEHQKFSANPRILMLPSSTSNDPIKKRGKGRPPSLRKQTIFKRKGKRSSIAEESPTQDKDSNQDMGSVDASTHEVEGGFLNLFMNVSQIALSEGGGLSKVQLDVVLQIIKLLD